MRRLWMMAMAMLFILLPISSALADEGGVVPTVQAENKITVLAYHHLEPQATGKHLTNSAILPIEEFNRHMKYLADNGYHTLSLDELLEFLAGRYEPPAHSVLITFDDGYESNYQYAFPVLAKYNFQAVIFVIGELADESARTVDTHTGEVVPFLKHVTNYSISSMLRTGFLEIGSHTYGNHRYIGDSPALAVLTHEEIKADLSHLDDTLTSLDIPKPRALAYPYGVSSPNVIVAARSLGYTLGFTVVPGYVRPGDDPMLLNRFSIKTGDDSQFISIVNGTWTNS